ncbi:MAG: hypothetical protein PWQ17_1213 [Anaerophaga sp.]|nr:hypothetical protein [Anaerophaga sp.]
MHHYNDLGKFYTNELISLPYRGYEVESLINGDKIVITKPGGKAIRLSQPMKEDFLVFVFKPSEYLLWQITHKQIIMDVKEKGKEDRKKTIKLIKLLKKTFNGEEPNDFLEDILELDFTTGATSETLIKAYKWIWGQEDVNYPNGKGRLMSWEAFKELKEQLK